MFDIISCTYLQHLSHYDKYLGTSVFIYCQFIVIRKHLAKSSTKFFSCGLRKCKVFQTFFFQIRSLGHEFENVNKITTIRHRKIFTVKSIGVFLLKPSFPNICWEILNTILLSLF